MHVRSKKEEVNFTDYKQLKCNNYIEEYSRNLSKYNTRNSIFSSPPPPWFQYFNLRTFFFILLIRTLLYFVLEHNIHLIFGCETCGNYVLTNNSITTASHITTLAENFNDFSVDLVQIKKIKGDNEKIEINTTEGSEVAQNEKTIVDISLVLMEKLEPSIGSSLVRLRRPFSNPLPLHLK